MSDLLPIEPGCLCLAFDPDLQQSQECVAVRKLSIGDEDPLFKGRRIVLNCWIVDRTLKYRGNQVNIPMAEDRYLMRIDGQVESEEDKFEATA